MAREGPYTVTAGRAFRTRKRRCILIVLWAPGQATPRVLLTDEPPNRVDLGAYGMRVWIEQGFRMPGAGVGSGTGPAAWSPRASTGTGWSWPWPPSGSWPTARAGRKRVCAAWPPAGYGGRP